MSHIIGPLTAGSIPTRERGLELYYMSHIIGPLTAGSIPTREEDWSYKWATLQALRPPGSTPARGSILACIFRIYSWLGLINCINWDGQNPDISPLSWTKYSLIRVDVVYFSSHYFKIEPDWRRWSRKKLHFCQANQVFLVFCVRGIVNHVSNNTSRGVTLYLIKLIFISILYIILHPNYYDYIIVHPN
jgi:hypothetical protein